MSLGYQFPSPMLWSAHLLSLVPIHSERIGLVRQLPESSPLGTADWMRDRHPTKVGQSAISLKNWNLESLTHLCWGHLGKGTKRWVWYHVSSKAGRPVCPQKEEWSRCAKRREGRGTDAGTSVPNSPQPWLYFMSLIYSCILIII